MEGIWSRVGGRKGKREIFWWYSKVNLKIEKKDSLINKWNWKNRIFPCRRMKPDLNLTSSTKVNSRGTKYLNVRMEIPTFLVSTGRTLWDLGSREVVLNNILFRGFLVFVLFCLFKNLHQLTNETSWQWKHVHTVKGTREWTAEDEEAALTRCPSA